MHKVFIKLSKSEFAQKKVSSNEDNTEYTIGGTGEGYVGTPDILYNQVVFVDNMIYTKGQPYLSNLATNIIDDTITDFTINTTLIGEKYEDLIIGQSVVCPNILFKYTKIGEGKWIKEKIDNCAPSSLPINNYTADGEIFQIQLSQSDIEGLVSGAKEIYCEYLLPTDWYGKTCFLSVGHGISTWQSPDGANNHYQLVIKEGAQGEFRPSGVPSTGNVTNNMTRGTPISMVKMTLIIRKEGENTVTRYRGYNNTDNALNTLYWSGIWDSTYLSNDLFDGNQIYIGSMRADAGGNPPYGTYLELCIRDSTYNASDEEQDGPTI